VHCSSASEADGSTLGALTKLCTIVHLLIHFGKQGRWKHPGSLLARSCIILALTENLAAQSPMKKLRLREEEEEDSKQSQMMKELKQTLQEREARRKEQEQEQDDSIANPLLVIKDKLVDWMKQLSQVRSFHFSNYRHESLPIFLTRVLNCLFCCCS